MNRRKSREVAMKILFESMIQKETYSEILNNLNENLNIEIERKKEEIYTVFEEDTEITNLIDVDMEYVNSTLEGIQVNREKIDIEIEKYLVNWKFNRIAKIDLAILRLGTYEILFDENIPDRVAVNEAIDITKKYSDPKSSAFVNGILNNMVRK